MSGYLATRDASEVDYEAIQLAVMETERGRWFLSEYARRNRHADTEVLLASLVRIERSISLQREPTEIDKFRLDVLEMSRAIARTRAEIAAIKPPESEGRIIEASGELDSIVSATESATSEILAAAEGVQEVAWTLREAGADPVACDQLDQHSIAIYTACSFQDLTAQRTRKVIEILGFLEKRVNAMADIWQFADETREEDKVLDPMAGSGIDPAMSQADVDFVLVKDEIENLDFEIEIPSTGFGEISAEFRAGPPDVDLLPTVAMEQPSETAQGALATSDAHPLDNDTGKAIVPVDTTAVVDDILFSEPEAVPAPTFESDGKPHLQLVPSPTDDIFSKAKAGGELSVEEAAAALDALRKMSVEERTKLFS